MAYVKGLDRLIVKVNKMKTTDVEQALKESCLLVENQAKIDCPVDTGQLRNSIHSEVNSKEGIVGTNVEYAPYVEFGTVKMQAQPFLYPALNKCRQWIVQIFRKYMGGRS